MGKTNRMLRYGIANMQNQQANAANMLANKGYSDVLDDYRNYLNKMNGLTFNTEEQNLKNYKTDQEKTNKDNLKQYIDTNFAGLGGSNIWLDNYWNNASDDAMVDNFINNNYNVALEQLDRALQRGTLSQSGYNNALENLNTQKSGAYSTIGDISQGILDKYKTALTEKAQSFGQDVDSYNFDQRNSVNAGKFKESFDNLYNTQKQGFENEFNLMTQDLQPFDVSGIIGNARVAQGVNNTQTDDLLNAIEDNEAKKDKKVGLGNKGLF